MKNEEVKVQKISLADDRLDDIVTELKQLNEEYFEHLKQAKKRINSAFKTRWKYGKAIYENMDYIQEKCGSQKAFAKLADEAESVISNNKRGYKYLLDHDCKTFDDVLELLDQRSIKPTVHNFEKIGTLLNEPDKDTEQKDQIDKDRKRLEEIRAEAEEILRRVEPMNDPELYEDALEFNEDIESIASRIDSFDIYKGGWKSEKYLEFVRNFGVDLITMEPCEKCDPHHTTPDGGTGGLGDKLPDYCVIPISRHTHNKIGAGLLEPTPEEILKAQFITLATFIKTHLK